GGDAGDFVAHGLVAAARDKGRSRSHGAVFFHCGAVNAIEHVVSNTWPPRGGARYQSAGPMFGSRSSRLVLFIQSCIADSFSFCLSAVANRRERHLMVVAAVGRRCRDCVAGM